MFAKLFARITESSLMEEPIEVRYTFVMLLAIADQTGHVIGTDVAIARRLNMPTTDFARCLAILMEPDGDSNSPELEGRRVVESEGERGYRIVNYLTYRNIRSEEERREYMANYMKSYRARKHSVNSVNSVNSGKLLLANTEAEAEANTEGEAEAEAAAKDNARAQQEPAPEPLEPEAHIPTLAEVQAEASMRGVTPETAQKFFDYYEGNSLWLNKHNRLINWRIKLVEWQAKDREKAKTTPKPYQGAGTGGKTW